MTIQNHKLDSASWVPTVHTSGTIKPTLILVHDTASRLTKGNVVNYLKRNKAKVSYHLVIERDGTVVQMAPFNKRCHHAGRSKHKGRKWCNGFSVGIGMVNPGALKGTDKRAKAWFGQVFEDNLVRRDTPAHGRGHVWLEYTPQQIDALDAVVMELRAAYGDLDISGHYNVSPGRKVDPTPLLDLASLGQIEPDVIEESPPAHKVLAKSSREYKATNAVKVVAGGGTIAGAIAEATKAADISNITAVKGYFDAVSGFVASYGVIMLVVGCGAAWGLMELVQHWKRDSYDSGRYEPSGEAENEAGGDWL